MSGPRESVWVVLASCQPERFSVEHWQAAGATLCYLGMS